MTWHKQEAHLSLISPFDIQTCVSHKDHLIEVKAILAPKIEVHANILPWKDLASLSENLLNNTRAQRVTRDRLDKLKPVTSATLDPLGWWKYAIEAVKLIIKSTKPVHQTHAYKGPKTVEGKWRELVHLADQRY